MTLIAYEQFSKLLTPEEIKLLEVDHKMRQIDDLEFIEPSENLIDKFMIDKLKKMFKKMQPKPIGSEGDWWLGIIGAEGVGKSTCANAIIYEWCKIANINYLEMLKNNIAFDSMDMMRIMGLMDIDHPYQFIWCDEGANVWFNRDSMTKARGYGIKFSNSMRFLRFLVIICSVEVAQLDTIIKDHRMKSLIRIEREGVYHYYGHEDLIRLSNYNEKKRGGKWNWSRVEPEHVGRYEWNENTEKITKNIKRTYAARFRIEALRAYVKMLKEKYGD